MTNSIYPVIGNEKTLPFFLTGIGECDPEYHVNRENGLVSHQLLLTTEGIGCLNVDECSYIMKKGSILYMPQSIPHEYFPKEGNWQTKWIVFRGNNISETMKAIGMASWCVRDNVDMEQLLLIWESIMKQAGDSVYSGERCSLLIYELVLAAKAVFSAAETVAAGSVIEKSIRYISGSFAGDISLEQLAENANVSLQHFCRLFKAQTGMRPMEYIARYRIAKAKNLLMSTDLPIKQIGEKTGYPDLTYFGMVFRKYEGISPSEYRKLKGSIVL